MEPGIHGIQRNWNPRHKNSSHIEPGMHGTQRNCNPAHMELITHGARYAWNTVSMCWMAPQWAWNSLHMEYKITVVHIHLDWCVVINGYVTHFWITLLLVYIASILITFTNYIHLLITTQCVLDFRWWGSEVGGSTKGATPPGFIVILRFFLLVNTST